MFDVWAATCAAEATFRSERVGRMAQAKCKPSTTPLVGKELLGHKLRFARRKLGVSMAYARSKLGDTEVGSGAWSGVSYVSLDVSWA